MERIIDKYYKGPTLNEIIRSDDKDSEKAVIFQQDFARPHYA